MNRRFVLLATGIILPLHLGGCKESSGSAAPVASTNAVAMALAAPSAALQPSAEIVKVIFVDKEHACKCTQKRVDDGWTALQGAIAGRQSPTVERLHADTQSTEVAPYTKQRAALTLPALYFMASNGALVEMLQGELTQAQIQTALGTNPSGH